MLVDDVASNRWRGSRLMLFATLYDVIQIEIRGSKCVSMTWQAVLACGG